MRQPVALITLVAAVVLSACGRAGPTSSPPTPTVPPSPVVSATAPELMVITATAPAPTPALPTPTALAEGLTVRLGTPDPSPNCPAHYPWFFENAAQECADVILQTWAVLQPFEHGLMLWTQEGGRTYVLLEDGGPFKPYESVADRQGLPLPAPDPSIVPPEGLYQPELGFALFWRGLVPGTTWVRERLGWATAPETAYGAFWQCSTAAGASARCYLNGPRDEIIVLASHAPYWTYVQTAVR